jgi:hypothetical protein
MTAAELLALAERVEGLSGPDREVDWHAHKLAPEPPRVDGDGLVIHNCGFMGVGRHIVHSGPAYTASLDAVVSLIEQVLPGWCWSVRSDYGASASVCPAPASPYGAHGISAVSAARALLAALLRAKAAEVAG